MSNFILKNISGSDLSLQIFANTPVETLSADQTINLLEYASVPDVEKSLKYGELKDAFANGTILLIKNAIGFLNKDNCAITATLSAPNISVSVAPLATSFSFNQQLDSRGVLSISTFTKTDPEILLIPFVSSESAFYKIYYSDDVLTYENINETTSAGFFSINRVDVCYLWFDGTSVFIFDLKQNQASDWVENLIKTDIVQIKYISGLQVNAEGLDPGQISISPGVLIQNTSEISASNEVNNPLVAPVLYREDTETNTGNNNWKSYVDPGGIIAYNSGGDIYYNKLENNIWSMQAASSNYYVPSWIVGTNCIEYPIMIIAGQEQYATLEEAKYKSRYDKLILDNTIIKTFKPLYRIILKNDGFKNVDIIDLRNKEIVGDFVGPTVSSGGGSITLGGDLDDWDPPSASQQRVVGIDTIPAQISNTAEPNLFLKITNDNTWESPQPIIQDGNYMWIGETLNGKLLKISLIDYSTEASIDLGNYCDKIIDLEQDDDYVYVCVYMSPYILIISKVNNTLVGIGTVPDHFGNLDDLQRTTVSVCADNLGNFYVISYSFDIELETDIFSVSKFITEDCLGAVEEQIGPTIFEANNTYFKSSTKIRYGQSNLWVASGSKDHGLVKLNPTNLIFLASNTDDVTARFASTLLVDSNYIYIHESTGYYVRKYNSSCLLVGSIELNDEQTILSAYGICLDDLGSGKLLVGGDLSGIYALIDTDDMSLLDWIDLQDYSGGIISYNGYFITASPFAEPN